MNDVIEEIQQLYTQYNVNLLKASNLGADVPDIADVTTRQVVINTNSKYTDQLPFRMTHELMHIVHSNITSQRMVAYHNYDVKNIEEKTANKEAIKLLWRLYSSTTDELNWVKFMECFGIPGFLENETLEIINSK
ncbi:hypothetical protein LABALGNA3A7_09400 [Dellaglioa algida]|nr:hypothetical protein LABALGNA3A7_09400 [Dellaglioa algida]